MPGVLTLVMVVPLVVTFVVSLVPTLVLCSALGAGFGFEAIVGAIVVSGVLAALVGLILAEGLDRYVQRPSSTCRRPTPVGAGAALVWPDARVIDRDAYLATIDDVVVEAMGWREEDVLKVRWQTLMPMASVLTARVRGDRRGDRRRGGRLQLQRRSSGPGRRCDRHLGSGPSTTARGMAPRCCAS